MKRLLALFPIMSLCCATAAPVAADNESVLSACLVDLANGPEFSAINSEELSQNDRFLSAALDGWCSDELIDFWPKAHDAARRELGAPEEGLPVIGQQILAKKKAKALVANAWREASALRSTPPPLTTEKQAHLGLIWLLDRDDAFLDPLMPTVKCAAEQMLAQAIPLAPENLGKHGAVKRSALGEISVQCQYDVAVDSVAKAIGTRFPKLESSDAITIADSYLGQVLFWATLAMENAR